MDLLWQCPAQKAVDWQGWMPEAYLKGGASWKKSHAVGMVVSAWYYSLWDFKPESDTIQTYTLKGCNMCMKI